MQLALAAAGIALKGSTLEHQLIAQVTANESQPLVKAVSIGARLVGRELDEIATSGSALTYRPFEHLLPNTGSPVCRSDSHRLDLSAPGALPCQSGNEGQLKGADHLVVRGRDHLQLVGIGKNGPKRIDIFRVCWRARILPLLSQCIVCEESNDGGKISQLSLAEYNLHDQQVSTEAPLAPVLPDVSRHAKSPASRSCETGLSLLEDRAATTVGLSPATAAP